MKPKSNSATTTGILPSTLPSGIGEVDADFDGEDTKEEITALLKEIENDITGFPQDLPEISSTSKLLLKLRGFIAKVGYLIQSEAALVLTYSPLGSPFTSGKKIPQKMLYRRKSGTA